MLTLVRLNVRLSRRGALIAAVALAAALAANASAWTAAYPTQVSRDALATLLGESTGFRALVGPPVAVNTIGGFIAWRLGVFALTALGVWGLLTTTRLLRGEEDVGRWEVVRSQPVTARSATVAVLGAFAIDVALVWAVVTATLLSLGPVYDIPATGSVAFTSALALGALAFASTGALAAQIASTRRAAAGIAGGVVAAAMALRVAADVGSAAWLRWTSPLGWLSEVRAYGGARPAVLLLYVAWIAVFVTLTLVVVAGRDAGAGLLPSRDRAHGGTAMLRTPELASIRFARGPAIAWIVGGAALALLLGSIASTVRDTLGGSPIEEFVGPLGSFSSVLAYLSFAVFFLLAVVAAFLLAGSISGHWEEERTGRADTALASAVSRRRWLGARIGVAAATASVVVVVASVAAWVGVSLTGGGVSLSSLVVAGLAVLPVAFVYLGAGSAVYGIVPRAAVTIAYGLVVASFLLDVIGSLSSWPTWVLSLSPLHHLSYAPLAPVDVARSLWLLLVAAVGVAVGVEAFARRDIRSA